MFSNDPTPKKSALVKTWLKYQPICSNFDKIAKTKLTNLMIGG